MAAYISTYFDLQYKIINRTCRDNGCNPLLAYIIFGIGFVGISFFLFTRISFAPYIYMLVALIYIGKLSKISRIGFLKYCFDDNKVSVIRLTENFICTLAFIVFLLYKQLFVVSLLLIVFAGILAFVTFTRPSNFILWTPFPKVSFEFTTGFRKTYYLVYLAHLLTGISIFVNNFNLGIFSLWLVFAIALSFYTNPENEYYVWTYSETPGKFLIRKIRIAISLSSTLVLPITLLLVIFFPNHILVLALTYLVAQALLMCTILSKYSTYPGEMRITQVFVLAICIWFPPVVIILIPYLFTKSKNSLSGLLK